MRHFFLIGCGSIGLAIARSISATGKHILLADLKSENAGAAAAVLSDASFEVGTATVDVSPRKNVESLVQQATGLGALALTEEQNKLLATTPTEQLLSLQMLQPLPIKFESIFCA